MSRSVFMAGENGGDVRGRVNSLWSFFFPGVISNNELHRTYLDQASHWFWFVTHLLVRNRA